MWHIGNTTVRTPYRLRAALAALVTSQLHGNLLGREKEQGFADLLSDRGLVHTARQTSSAEVDHSDLGRKWRAALSQLGFVSPHLTIGHRYGVDQRLKPFTTDVPALTGAPYEVTSAGRRLIESEDLRSQQECFLRALAAYRIPSILESRYRCRQFSPLSFTLKILLSIADLGGEAFVSFTEMALFVQRSTADDDIAEVTARILSFRAERERTKIPLRQFDRQAYREAVLEDDPHVELHRVGSKMNTIDDYADLNLRYLKATGLFKGRGRGITVSSERIDIARYLAGMEPEPLDDESYLQQLWDGAVLPTDDRATAVAVARSLDEAIHKKGTATGLPDIDSLDDEQLQGLLHRLEEQLQHLDEEQFADQQADAVEEIVGWMNAILAGGRKSLADGTKVSVPRGEMAAYLEWIIWRAFLAIDSLENKPWEARRFSIDQDSLPVAHAPGGGPDMSFIFEDVVIVVEVTLTASSRQEAAEGEPVRRHVARYVEDNTTGKAVFGLFVAPRIDTNTAHTFRSGDWYTTNDEKINVHIVPMRLEDFRDFFRALLLRREESPRRLRELLVACRMEANQEAPQWKRKIAELTGKAVRELYETC